MSLAGNSPSPERYLGAFERSSEPNPIFCKYLLKVFTAYLWPRGGLTIEGAENLPEEGSYIVSPNHISHLDTAVVGKAVLDTTGHNLHFMAKREFWEGRFNRITGGFVELGGGFPINRGNSFADQPQVATRLDQIFSSQEPLCMYPQGTRIEKGEEITKLKAGIGLLAVKYGVPVIPAGISGSLERDHMTIVFGQPVQAEHSDFDLTNSSEIKQVSGPVNEFRSVLAEQMQLAKVAAETIRLANLS